MRFRIAHRNGRVDAAAKFNNIVVARLTRTPVKISDLGYAEDTTERPTSAMWMDDGAPAVLVDVRRATGENTIRVIEDVKRKLAAIRPTLPRDLDITTTKDDSEFIYASIASLEEHLLWGSLLAAVVVMFFIRNIRAVLNLGGHLVTAFPEGHPNSADGQIVLIRVLPGLLQPAQERSTWAPQGFIAYSKVCTHAGCPVGLYQSETHQLLCPCHQSAFDVLNEAKVVFGPAFRALPQLPLAIDAQGYLIAQSDFHEPIGPSYWNRG